MGAYLAKIQALDSKKTWKIQVNKIFHHIQPRHCTFRALLNCLKQLNNAQTCAKAHKDGQSHKIRALGGHFPQMLVQTGKPIFRQAIWVHCVTTPALKLFS